MILFKPLTVVLLINTIIYRSRKHSGCLQTCRELQSDQIIKSRGNKPREGTRNVSKAINVTKEEEQMIKELIDKGIDVEIRMVPNDTSIDAKTVIE